MTLEEALRLIDPATSKTAQLLNLRTKTKLFVQPRKMLPRSRTFALSGIAQFAHLRDEVKKCALYCPSSWNLEDKKA